MIFSAKNCSISVRKSSSDNPTPENFAKLSFSVHKLKNLRAKSFPRSFLSKKYSFGAKNAFETSIAAEKSSSTSIPLEISPKLHAQKLLQCEILICNGFSATFGLPLASRSIEMSSIGRDIFFATAKRVKSSAQSVRIRSASCL